MRRRVARKVARAFVAGEVRHGALTVARAVSIIRRDARRPEASVARMVLYGRVVGESFMRAARAASASLRAFGEAAGALVVAVQHEPGDFQLGTMVIGPRLKETDLIVAERDAAALPVRTGWFAVDEVV